MVESNPPKSNQATEVFRFVCGRPAIKDKRSIKIRPLFFDATGETRPRAVSTSSALETVSSQSLKFTKKIVALDKALDLDASKVDTGRNIELETKLVRDSIKAVFGIESLSTIISSDDWKNDEAIHDIELIKLWKDSNDPNSIGPLFARHRQLYDLVRQAADVHTGKQGEEPFYLKGLELGSIEASQDDNNHDDNEDDGDADNDGSNNNNTRPRRQTVLTLLAQTPAEKAQADLIVKIQNLLQGLRVLNSTDIFRYRPLDKKKPTEFLVQAKWVDELLAGDVQTAVHNAGILTSTPDIGITWHYNTIMRAIRDADTALRAASPFKSGLFSIGLFNLEMVKPWTVTLGQNTSQPAQPEDGTSTTPPILPRQQRSQIKPTGVGDLLVVRDHVWKYIGGEIGAIQNVLKSEWLVRETKRLDRTELVEFSSNEVTTEEDKEESTTTRFALSKETNDLIKQDSSTKAGVSATAYGPYVTVKGDFSTAQNNASESSNKTASQYAQDLTSRATSKIIEKTFNSKTRTTISEFRENNRHEFKNTDGGSNISGIYQWVNKVSQCQMWNYGKRLLIDIAVPEPAAFLMTQSGEAGPSLENPPPLTEIAADIHEGNYSAIAARYQATGINPPADFLISFSKSFKADAMASGGPKLGGGDPFRSGGPASLNLDIDIPTGFLVYAVKIQVGIRTGRVVDHWSVFENQVYPEYGNSYDTPNPYISVAGRVIAAGRVTKDDIDPVASAEGTVSNDDSVPSGQTQNTVGVVFFKDPLLKGTVALTIAQDLCVAISGTIQICCVREPNGYAKWQQQTYDAILTAYTKVKMDYERSRAETAISTLSVTTGNNPLENTSIISTELKKAAISFITAQNYKVFGSVTVDPEDKIPEVAESDFDKAIKQGNYADFFEKAFEWENMTYALYPYFWANRSTWRERIGFHSPDPAFSAFVKAGVAKVTIPVRLGFGIEAIHFLDRGKIWQGGPVSTLATSEYYSVAQEILAAEAQPDEVKVSDPWYTVIPTELVQLRKDDILPRFKTDNNGVWIERKIGDPDWDA
jgi:hypothetical protein